MFFASTARNLYPENKTHALPFLKDSRQQTSMLNSVLSLRHFWRHVAETSATQIYGVLTSVLILVLTARFLGPAGRGVVGGVGAWTTLFVNFSFLSLGQVAIYQASSSPAPSWFSKAFTSLLLLNLMLSTGCCAIGWSMYAITRGAIFGHLPATALLVGFLIIPFQIWDAYGSNLLMAINRLRVYNRTQIVGRSIGLGAVYVLVGAFKFGALGAIAGTVLAQATTSLIGIRELWQHGGERWDFDWAEITSLLKGAAKLHMNAVGFLLVSQADILVLNYYSSTTYVGLYQLAKQLITAMAIVPTAISLVLYSRMAELGPDRLWDEQKKIGCVLLPLLVIAAVVAYVSAPWIIPMVAGRRFGDAVYIFQDLLPALMGMSFSTFMVNQWIGRGLFVQAALITLVSGIFTFGLDYFLIARYSVMGAIIATNIVSLGFALIVNVPMFVWCNGKSRTAIVARRLAQIS